VPGPVHRRTIVRLALAVETTINSRMTTSASHVSVGGNIAGVRANTSTTYSDASFEELHAEPPLIRDRDTRRGSDFRGEVLTSLKLVYMELHTCGRPGRP
jgi:hypothetical protein